MMLLQQCEHVIKSYILTIRIHRCKQWTNWTNRLGESTMTPFLDRNRSGINFLIFILGMEVLQQSERKIWPHI